MEADRDDANDVTIHGYDKPAGAAIYPEGMEWRCMLCDFACTDGGPDLCPNDGFPMTRTVANLKTATAGRKEP